MEDTTKIAEQEFVCVVCGEKFVPNGTDTTCCSPLCRARKVTLQMKDIREKEKSEEEMRLEALTFPPKFNLKIHPKARVEWFSNLPDRFKKKFARFLTDEEQDMLRAMAQKSLSEEKFYSGLSVKKGKVIDSRSSSDDEGVAEREIDTRNTEGTDDDL